MSGETQRRKIFGTKSFMSNFGTESVYTLCSLLGYSIWELLLEDYTVILWQTLKTELIRKEGCSVS